MGNLLKLLIPRDESRDSDKIFVDFENVQPTPEERELYDKVQTVLHEGRLILQKVHSYDGATEDIRQAISHPSNEDYQEKAWQSVCPLAMKLKEFYEFSVKLDTIVPDLLEVLCSNEKTPVQHLETQQALFKQFADILDFVLSFDDLKMTNPAIQNDFSYYRRTLSRQKLANEEVPEQDENILSNEIANRMSLFYAQSTPMLIVLSDATTRFVTSHKDIPVENTTDCLSAMAKICRIMIENPELCARWENVETKLFCLRVMVGVIILYDHVHAVGAFAKTSGIDIKGSIKVLKDQEGSTVDGLLNALRFTTKHLNDDTTPKSIKQMLS